MNIIRFALIKNRSFHINFNKDNCDLLNMKPNSKLGIKKLKSAAQRNSKENRETHHAQIVTKTSYISSYIHKEKEHKVLDPCL